MLEDTRRALFSCKCRYHQLSESSTGHKFLSCAFSLAGGDRTTGTIVCTVPVCCFIVAPPTCEKSLLDTPTDDPPSSLQTNALDDPCLQYCLHTRVLTSTFRAPPKIPATPLALLRSTGELIPWTVFARNVSATLSIPPGPCDAPRFLRPHSKQSTDRSQPHLERNTRSIYSRRYRAGGCGQKAR